MVRKKTIWDECCSGDQTFIFHHSVFSYFCLFIFLCLVFLSFCLSSSKFILVHQRWTRINLRHIGSFRAKSGDGSGWDGHHIGLLRAPPVPIKNMRLFPFPVPIDPFYWNLILCVFLFLPGTIKKSLLFDYAGRALHRQLPSKEDSLYLAETTTSCQLNWHGWSELSMNVSEWT